MGITGLLPLLKSIQKPCHLKKFAGQVIGIDAYGWLHRGAHACSTKLALEQPTTQYVEFCMKRVHMLIHFGVTPYLVFDGDYLPSKSETEKERAKQRKDARQLGESLLRAGKTTQAHQELLKAVDITPEVAAAFIRELQRANVKYVVAPYEADAQLVYLEQRGVVTGILSEDSDLLVFGAKTLLTKLDQYGECIMVRRQDFTACREVSLVGWSQDEFRKMAILSGCDYLKSASSMGLKTAYRHLRKYKNVERIITAARFDGKIKFPVGYLEAFTQAERTFLYQWVYCSEAQGLVNLNPLPADITVGDIPYIGEYMETDVAQGVAKGELHPHTKLPLKHIPQKTASGPLDSMISSIRRRSNAENVVQDTKKGQSIETFFRKRMPLQELDPNNFRPSLSQQRLLEDHQGSFTSNLVTGGTSLRAALGASGGTRSSTSARRAVSDSVSSIRSTKQQPKRQRLCSDSMIDVREDEAVHEDKGHQLETETSRFFSSTAPSKTSPSSSRKRARKSDSNDFEIKSDEVIQDACTKLPEKDDGFVKPRKKLSILADVPATPNASLISETPGDNSQLSNFTDISVFSQATVGTLTPATSFGGSPREPSTQESPSIFSDYLHRGISNLRSLDKLPSPRYLDSPSVTTKRTQAARKLLRTSSAPTGSSKLMSKPRGDVPPPSSLQILEAAKSDGNSPLTDLNEDPEPVLAEVSDFKDADWAAIDSAVVVPQESSKQPQSQVPASSPSHEQPSKISVSATAGSEDMLVPDSEGESDRDPHSPPRAVFDVSKFAFGV